ncbi:MAG: hypothetical protein M1828_001596 [Chrysothrix sp. TS-e1954]|nr:MAG: hypothetical protein M1828_001596 [Chrysothrix sp. TS-e1954]
MPIRSVPSSQPTSNLASASASIEQSVKIFRLYEALRSGDTAAISKVIRETSHGADGDTGSGALEGTSIVHLAVQCADVPVIEFVLSNATSSVDVNARDKDGNTPLHVASMLSRAPVVKVLLEQKDIDESVLNYHGRAALDLAKNPEVFQQLHLARSLYIDTHIKRLQSYVNQGDSDALEKLLSDSHFQNTVDVNGPELAIDPTITQTGGTLLHEAAKRKDAQLIEVLLLNGADPFKRDRKGKLPQDITKDDKTKTLLKKSPAAAAAQRGIQEKTILGSGAGAQTAAAGATAENALGGKEGREMKGYLKKWTNYTSGYKLRWFVLEDGVLSYYKHQDDAGSACRGAINMKIAKLHMDAQDKLRFEIHGKSSVKYHLKANHQVEAKRWFWSLNNAIQWTKDEAKEDQKRHDRTEELMRQAKTLQNDKASSVDGDGASIASSKRGGPKLTRTTSLGQGAVDEDDGAASFGEPSIAGDETPGGGRRQAPVIPGDIDDDDEYDEGSSGETRPINRDAFMIAAQSARLQLDLLAQVSNALQTEKSKNPDMPISDPTIVQALNSYESAVSNLMGLVGDLGRITRDREAYWHYRLEQEVNIRRVWEESMAKVAQEHEDLENRIGESEEKRKRTKRALRDALEGQLPTPSTTSPVQQREQPILEMPDEKVDPRLLGTRPRAGTNSGIRKKSTIAEMTNISDSESEDDEEFFDAVDAGEVEVVGDLPSTVASPPAYAKTKTSQPLMGAIAKTKSTGLQSAYKGYEDPVRQRLNMDADNRPKISLWGILKSMIGKDMTKMTLPVSFNEPTSLLQRVAEDMEYTDLLDIAAGRADSTERMLYVAAFAASEYASTTGRVAKPFNPLLGETYEYARPDKGFRFFVEQVSHHPPVGAAWAESTNWDYFGESAVRSKFYGRSFDINPLGTWFLKLRPTAAVTASAGSRPDVEETYTWKKVTSSVVGIITGSPTVDNVGPMEIKNHSTGEICLLDFKPRGWKASSAYQVTGKVLDKDGNTRWSIGGRWNDKIYARLTPGYEANLDGSVMPLKSGANAAQVDSNQAFLVWEAHSRPSGIPFNLTPFVLTLNAVPERLRLRLPPTDTRLRPDQRAMEEGEYDFAATEKNRVEEKQRAKRRDREAKGEEFIPQWFTQKTDSITGEKFWDVRRRKNSTDAAGNGEVEYWALRDTGDWDRCEDIF